MVAHYDRIYLQTKQMFVEGDKVVDHDAQWSLPCYWEAGQCHAEGRTYMWNITEGNLCQVALVKEFLGH